MYYLPQPLSTKRVSSLDDQPIVINLPEPSLSQAFLWACNFPFRQGYLQDRPVNRDQWAEELWQSLPRTEDGQIRQRPALDQLAQDFEVGYILLDNNFQLKERLTRPLTLVLKGEPYQLLGLLKSGSSQAASWIQVLLPELEAESLINLLR